MFPFLTKFTGWESKSYLEIGVAEGYTLAAAVTGWELQKLVLCDNWSGEYGGPIKREDHRHLELLLGQLNFPLTKVTFLDGDSQTVIPEYFAQNPQDVLDVIFIDGDHSREGLLSDLNNTINRGLVIIIHDMQHPAHPYLKDVLYDFYKQVWQTYTLIIDRDLGYLMDRRIIDA